MATTRAKIAQQIQRLLNGGDPASPSFSSEEELFESIGQVLNKLLKIDYLTVSLPNGVILPSGNMMVTYDNLPVFTYKNVSKCLLPAIPVALPMDIGLYYVGPAVVSGTANFFNSEFIPIPIGFSGLISSQPVLSNLFGQIGYERRGKEIIFYSDITSTPNNINSVMVQMLVMDMSQYSDYDLLPIPPDMESECVNAVYKLFLTQRSPDKIDDPMAEVNPPK